MDGLLKDIKLTDTEFRWNTDIASGQLAGDLSGVNVRILERAASANEYFSQFSVEDSIVVVTQLSTLR